jgi:hypothetical protein
MAELCSVTTLELKSLFAMVNRIKYTPVADIVNYFKNVHKMSGPIECTSMVTWIAINLVSYPVPRNRERSLHTCAQDVQITRMATI